MTRKLKLGTQNKGGKLTYRITIPKAIIEAMNWHRGDLLSFTIVSVNELKLKKTFKQQWKDIEQPNKNTGNKRTILYT